MTPADFSTITGLSWSRALPAARARRRPEAVRARRFSGPACPVCGRPGFHRTFTGGTEIIHSEIVRCWQPVGCGHVTTGRAAA